MRNSTLRVYLQDHHAAARTGNLFAPVPLDVGAEGRFGAEARGAGAAAAAAALVGAAALWRSTRN